MEILTYTTNQHEKEMGDLCRQLEEERRCSASLKDSLSILQQQLCDAERSAQVNFQKL
jgi:kinesin family member 5